MTDTLDMPQYSERCASCRRPIIGDSLDVCWCYGSDPTPEPTLTYADFEAYMATVAHPQPDPFDVWDLLEDLSDPSQPTNRSAIDRAVREVGFRCTHRVMIARAVAQSKARAGS